jgi:hypothetical protein
MTVSVLLVLILRGFPWLNLHGMMMTDAFVIPASWTTTTTTTTTTTRSDILTGSTLLRGATTQKVTHHSWLETGPAVITTTTLHGSRLWMTSTPDDDDNDARDAENLPLIKKKLTKEFFSIGFPAFIQLAAEPLAALVDVSVVMKSRTEVSWKFVNP